LAPGIKTYLSLLQRIPLISSDPYMKATTFEFLHSFDGIRIRSGFWETDHRECRGTVVLLGGRAEFIEKYRETIQDLMGRGFDVFSMDWRGQGLSDRILGNVTKGYVESYEHYIRDLQLYIETFVSHRCRRPLMVMAHSMGASIVLLFLKRFSHLVDSGILMSPMIDVRTKPFPYAVAKWCSRLLVRMGKGEVAIPSFQRNDSFLGPFRQNWLTGDPARFKRTQRLLKHNPRLSVNTVTFRWLLETFAALDHFREPGFCESIDTPLLLVAAGRDRVVSNEAIAWLVEKLPHGRMITLAEARHEILQERDGVRGQFWRAFDRFVQR